MWDSCNILKLTTACKRMKNDGRYQFVRSQTEEKKLVKRSKKERNISFPIQTQPPPPPPPVDQPLDHLSSTTDTLPVNLSMIITQSYKPLHTKSLQFNKNTIAVTKGTLVKALYTKSNWVFIEILATGETGFIPIYCLNLSQSPSQNNISLFNVSIYDKPHQSMVNNHSYSLTLPPPGRFISTIGPCYLNDSIKTQTFTRPKNRLRVIENYQRKFVGDISVIESEVVTLIDRDESNNDWRLVERGDGKQGYIPKHIVKIDEKLI